MDIVRAMTAIIEAKNVTKKYRQIDTKGDSRFALWRYLSPVYSDILAVNEISFSVHKGEAVGYVGLNGAGKSTMIKLLTGILVPTSGAVSVFDRIPHMHRVENARKIGVVFGQRSQLWWELPLEDSFYIHKAIYGIADDVYRRNLNKFTELLGLGDLLHRPARQLSLGQRMRAEICIALLHSPEILFLDEPTIGLDVLAKEAVRKFLKDLNLSEHVTIVLTTHDLQDIEEVCPKIIIVDGGRKLFDGRLSDLRSGLGASRKLKLEFKEEPGDVTVPWARIEKDFGLTKYYSLERDDVSIIQILSRMPSSVELKDISLEQESTEGIIRSFYKEKARALLQPQIIAQ